MTRQTALTRAADRVTNTAGATGSVRPYSPQVYAWRAELRASGFKVSAAAVARLYALWQRTHDDDGAFLAHVLSYVDPTGEDATNAVLRQRACAGGDLR